MHLFHYHLVTSELREVEARYLGKLGFDLVARYGRIGDDHVTVEPGVSLGGARPRRVQAPAVASSSAARSTSSSSPATGGCRASTTSASRSTRTSSRRCSQRAAQLEPARAGARRPADVRLDERRLPARGAPAARLDRRPARSAGDELRLAELQLRADEPGREGGRARGPPRPRADERRRGRRSARRVVRFLPAARRAGRSCTASGSPERSGRGLAGGPSDGRSSVL